MIHNCVNHAQDLNSNVRIFFCLNLSETDIQKNIQVINVEKIFWLFFRKNNTYCFKALVETISSASVCQMKKLFSIVILILDEFIIS